MITQTMLIEETYDNFDDSLNEKLVYLAELGAEIVDIKYQTIYMSRVRSALIIYKVETI